mmetsp:Transcript_66766/g.206788  ORF Transcript_66766/g.206788 Transcript_66766/m.206788 type:complete len:295 (+) Transcript_66766:310-1194(+)
MRRCLPALPGPLCEESVAQQHGRQQQQRRGHCGMQLIDGEQTGVGHNCHCGQNPVGGQRPVSPLAEAAQPPPPPARQRPPRLQHAMEADGGALPGLQSHGVTVGLGVGLTMHRYEQVQEADAEDKDRHDEEGEWHGEAVLRTSQGQNGVHAVAVNHKKQLEGVDHGNLPLRVVLVEGEEGVREADKGDSADDEHAAYALEGLEDGDDASDTQRAQAVGTEGVEELDPAEEGHGREDCGVVAEVYVCLGAPGENVEEHDGGHVDIVPDVQEVRRGVIEDVHIAVGLSQLSERLPE